jgi:photosystem II stability/assembly factor-like uncharacterized protein
MKIIKSMLLAVAAWGGLFTVADPAFSQTWTPTSSPSNNWNTVASSADGSKLIAGGMPWIYCISTNSGTTWITNTQPQNGSTYGSWSCIASSADGTKYVGILGNVIWVSTDSGTTWLSNNVPGVAFFGCVALSADGTKLVVVVGNNSSPGPIYTSTNSGLTWTLTGAPTNNSWATVASSADGSKLVAASWAAFVPNHIYGCVYTSTNLGMTWTSNNVPDAQWNSVASSADGTKLVAVAVEPGGLIYSSTNSGATWISNNVPNGFWLSVASSADGNQLVLAGMADQSFNPGHVYISQTTSSPCLNLTPSSSNLAVAWIIPSTNFVLQQNSDLTTTNWTDVTNPPVLNLTNLQNEVTFPLTGSNAFYRLKTP